MAKIKKQKEFELRFERHQSYVSRQWQYFAGFMILQGFLLNALVNIQKENILFLSMIIISGLVTTVVFLHLLVWINVRIHRNAEMLNSIYGKDFVELPKIKYYQGITFWLSISIILFAVCWLILLYSKVGIIYGIIFTILLIIIMSLSIFASNKLHNKDMI